MTINILTKFLKNIADAIRYAEKSANKIKANDFANRIKELEVCILNWINHMKQIRAGPQGLFYYHKSVVVGD